MPDQPADKPIRPLSWNGLVLFDDLPKRKVDDSDICRLKPAVDTLFELLKRTMTPAKGPPDQLRIGLFSGLGQGKSTAANALISRLSGHFGCCFRGPLSVKIFDASHHRADILEFDFDRVVGLWLVLLWFRRRLPLLLSLSALIAFAILMAKCPEGVPKCNLQKFSFTNLLVPAVPLLVPPVILMIAKVLVGWSAVAHYLRDIERRMLFRLSYTCHPTLLVVDNLDRASVPQQRALLKALYKHSDQLHLPVLVVMDETALISKPGDPEAPEELLRKVIQAECRLPVRTAADAVQLVVGLSEEAAERNDGNLAGTLFKDARLRGDWVRVFTLLPGLGPRRVKRFLNDLLLSARQMELRHPDDLAAMTRLKGLFELVPELRGAAVSCINALAANDADQLIQVWRQVAPSKASELNPETLRFFNLTRHMGLSDTSWQRLAAQLAKTTPTDGLIQALQRVGAGYLSDYWRGGTPEKQYAKHDTGVIPMVTELMPWLTIEATSAETVCPLQRDRIFWYWRNEINGEDGLDAERKAETLLLLYRVWLGDAEVLETLSTADRQALIRKANDDLGERLFRLLIAVPNRYLSFVDRMQVVTNPAFGVRDWRSVDPWLASGPEETKGSSPEDLLTVGTAGSFRSVASHAWPPPNREMSSAGDATAYNEIKGHFRALLRLHQLRTPVHPHALAKTLFDHDWLKSQAEIEPVKLMVAISSLFDISPDPATNQHWQTDAFPFDAFDSLVADVPEPKVKEIVDILAQPVKLSALRGKAPWWVAFLCAVRYGEGPLIREWTQDICMKPSCSNVGAAVTAALAKWCSNRLNDPGVFPADAIFVIFGEILNTPRSSGEAPSANDGRVFDLIHNQLAKRPDYVEILSRVTTAPALPRMRTSSLGLQADAAYLDHIALILRAGALQRRETAIQLLEQLDNVHVANRSLLDAAGILTRQWQPREDWIFTDLDIVADIATPLFGSDDPLHQRLIDRIAEAQSRTWPSFQAFAETFPVDADAYEASTRLLWNLPYLFLTIEQSIPLTFALKERVKAITSRLTNDDSRALVAVMVTDFLNRAEFVGAPTFE